MRFKGADPFMSFEAIDIMKSLNWSHGKTVEEIIEDLEVKNYEENDEEV